MAGLTLTSLELIRGGRHIFDLYIYIHPNRQTASMGTHTQDHSADHGLNMSRCVRLPSELLDVDTQDTSDHTVNTTDNNPLDTTDKILNTDHPPQVPSTLQILESLAGDTPRQLVVPDTVSDADVDGIDTRNRIIRDPGDDPDIGVLTQVGAEAVDGQNPVPNTGTRKRTRDDSLSPDKTHKKVRDDDGTIRETVTDVHDDTRSKFYKIKYVPGRTHSCHSPPLSVPQQADEKKTLLEAMTPAQRTDWHRGRNSQLSSDKAASRYSWLDQALAHEINTHWAFGTIGLPSWLTTDERTINSIFQIRSNAAREVMDVAREHLRRENLKLKAEADDILGDIENTLQPDQAKTSRRLIAQHSDRHMTIFTEDLSERREWLISHQPTMTETMSMRPDSTRQTPGGKLPAELLSEDEPATASRTLNPTTNKKRKNRPKKKSRAAANPLSTAKPPPPRATPPAGTVDNGRPAAPPPKVPASANRTANRRNTTSSGNVTTRPRENQDSRVKGTSDSDRSRQHRLGQRSRSPRRDNGNRDTRSDASSRDHRPARRQGYQRSRSPCDRHRRDDRRQHSPARHSRRSDDYSRRHTETTSHFRDGQRANRDTRESGRQRQSRHNSPLADRRD